MTLYIGVIGEAVCDEKTQQLAERVGRLLAESKAVLVCGGMGGVMEGASRGAKLAGGMVIGILPGLSRNEENPYLTSSVVTGMGEGRNIILVRSCDAMIAIKGSYGTLSEIAFAHKLGIPLMGLNTWSLRRDGQVDEKIIQVSDPNEAVARALDLARRVRQGKKTKSGA